MRLYNRIMVPANEKETSPHFIAGGMWEAKPNAIVVTIKDLQDLWDAARYHGDYPHLNPDFTQYLKEQGITIP